MILVTAQPDLAISTDEPGKVGDRAPEELDRVAFGIGSAHPDRGQHTDDGARDACGDEHRRVVPGQNEPEGEQERRQT